jgi:hypothetical protein
VHQTVVPLRFTPAGDFARSANWTKMEAFAGIDVAFAKRKYLPISVCVWHNRKLMPLPLRAKQAPAPPRGHGNAKILDGETVREFAESTLLYLREVEKSLDRKGIRCITTPDTRQFKAIRTKAQAHLSGGGEESRLPHANQLWVNSCCKCTMQFFIVDFMWCLVVKALSWSMIKFFHRQCKVFIGYFHEIHSFWKILP